MSLASELVSALLSGLIRDNVHRSERCKQRPTKVPHQPWHVFRSPWGAGICLLTYAAAVSSRCIWCLQGDSNLKWANEAAKWGADFLACCVEQGRVLMHIGDIKKDQSYLGRAEDYPKIDRNILFCDTGALLSRPLFIEAAVWTQWKQVDTV
jgi:hypothetical protein